MFARFDPPRHSGDARCCCGATLTVSSPLAHVVADQLHGFNVAHDACRHRMRRAKDARDERDHYVRIVYRLDAAISHHERASDDRFREAHDDALYAARERIMRDAGQAIP